MNNITYFVSIHWLTRSLVLSDGDQYEYSMTYQQDEKGLPSIIL